MSKNQSFEYESYQDAETIAVYLKALMDGFRNKRIAFSSSDREIVLQPDDLLKLEVKASTRADRGKITLRVSWKSGRPGEQTTMNIDS